MGDGDADGLACRQVSHHRLLVRDPDVSLEFYRDHFGLVQKAGRHRDGVDCYWLGFDADEMAAAAGIPDHPHALLELIHDPSAEFSTGLIAGRRPGYWKIALAVADLEIARQSLIANGLETSAPVQVPDVAYLCHCSDPDGYDIELIQHRFADRHTAPLPDSKFALGTQTSFNLITYRVRDPAASISFYCNRLGLRLLSKQVLEDRGFTLYFLSADTEPPPDDDVEAIGIREWLWQRPYTLIELQHLYGSEQDPEFHYPVGIETGFCGIRLLGEAHVPSAIQSHPLFDCPFVSLRDPDGYSIEVLLTG